MNLLLENIRNAGTLVWPVKELDHRLSTISINFITKAKYYRYGNVLETFV